MRFGRIRSHRDVLTDRVPEEALEREADTSAGHVLDPAVVSEGVCGVARRGAPHHVPECVGDAERDTALHRDRASVREHRDHVLWSDAQAERDLRHLRRVRGTQLDLSDRREPHRVHAAEKYLLLRGHLVAHRHHAAGPRLRPRRHVCRLLRRGLRILRCRARLSTRETRGALAERSAPLCRNERAKLFASRALALAPRPLVEPRLREVAGADEVALQQLLVRPRLLVGATSRLDQAIRGDGLPGLRGRQRRVAVTARTRRGAGGEEQECENQDRLH